MEHNRFHNMELKDFLIDKHPSIMDEYRRYTTPNYYENGVLYYPVDGGFGNLNGSKNQRLKLISSSISKNNIEMTFEDIKSKTKYCCFITEAYKKLARVDENSPCKYNVNITSGTRYLIHNGSEYTIQLMYWLNHEGKRHDSKIWIRRLNDPVQFMYGRNYEPFYELYSVIGKSSFSLKHVRSYDTVARENYDFYANLTIRRAKEIIFGTSDVKIPALPDASIFKDFNKFFIKG